MTPLFRYASLIALVLILFLPQISRAGENGPTRKSFSGSTLGLRLGWSGGLNGITYRIGINGSDSGFELTFGYSPKEGRSSGLPVHKRGNLLFSARYQPMFLMTGNNLEVGFFGSLGLSARAHLYRPFGHSSRGLYLTPDLLGGGGFHIQFNDGMQIFADIHLKYYNRFTNQYQMSYESGIGIRFRIN